MRANSDLSVQSSLLNQVYVDAAKYKDAFESIRKIVGQESSLDKIVADFVKVEDQNFALFNYVTEMNNQVTTHECAGRTVLVVGDINLWDWAAAAAVRAFMRRESKLYRTAAQGPRGISACRLAVCDSRDFSTPKSELCDVVARTDRERHKFLRAPFLPTPSLKSSSSLAILD